MSADLAKSCDQALQTVAEAFQNTEINVGQTERIVSAIGGGLVLMTAANLRSLSGLMATLLGAGLIYRGISGHCPMNTMMGRDTSEEGETASRRLSQLSNRKNPSQTSGSH